MAIHRELCSAEGATPLYAVWDDGTVGSLVFDGDGDIDPGYLSAEEYPWNSYRSKINYIEFTDKMTIIPPYAFQQTAIINLTLPSSMQAVENGAFDQCESLVDVIIDGDNLILAPSLFSGRNTLKQVIFRGNILEVGESCFSGCEGLEVVVNEANIDTLGMFAFYKCIGLMVFDNQGVIKMFGEYSVAGAGALESIAFTEGTESIEAHAFEASNLNAEGGVSFPSTLTRISSEAFKESGVKKITLNEGLTELGGAAFQGCVDLQQDSLTIPSTITYLQASVFDNCIHMTGQLILNDGLEMISANAFSGTPLTGTLNCPDSLKSIEDEAFWNCRFNKLYFNVNLEHIGTNAFKGCSNVITINFLSTSAPDLGEGSFSFIETGEKTTPVSTYGWGNNSVFTVNVRGIESNVFTYLRNDLLKDFYCKFRGKWRSAALFIKTKLPTETEVNWKKMVDVFPHDNDGYISPNEFIELQHNEGGKVYGGTIEQDDQHITLFAVAEQGYIFKHWLKDGEIMSTESIYAVEIPSDPVIYVGIFEQV